MCLYLPVYGIFVVAAWTKQDDPVRTLACCLSLSLPVYVPLSSLSLSVILYVSLMWQLLTHCAFCERPNFTMEVCCSRQQLLRL